MLLFQYKYSFGNHRYYPQCPTSKMIIRLMNKKCIDCNDIGVLQSIYKVDVYTIDKTSKTSFKLFIDALNHSA